MVDSSLEASRPSPRRTRKSSQSAQKQATDTIFKGLDRFGLAPILLLALVYLGHTQVVQPIATAYVKMVSQVGDTNEMLKKAIEQNNKEDMERVAVISAAQALNQSLAEQNRDLNTRILEALDTADEDRRKMYEAVQDVLGKVIKALENRDSQ